MKKILTEDEVFAEFAKRFPVKAKQKKIVLSKKEIDTHNSVWKEEFTSQRGRYKKEFFDTKKEAEYKNCLFTIYKHHWDTDDGFQINMKNVGKMIGKTFRTVDNMILVFIKCGLLKRTHNYLVGKQTYYYHKNSALFKYLFSGLTHDYRDWLYQHRLSIVDNKQYIINSRSNNISNQNDINNVFNVCSNVEMNRSGRNGKKTDSSNVVVDNNSQAVSGNNLSKVDSHNDTQYSCSNVEMNRSGRTGKKTNSSAIVADSIAGSSNDTGSNKSDNQNNNNDTQYSCSNVEMNRSGKTGKKTDSSSLYVVDTGSSNNNTGSNEFDTHNDMNNNQIYCSNVETNRNRYQRIANEFLPILDKLNRKQHPDLQTDFGLHFDNKGNCSGRSSSYFCLTLNEGKEHNSDNSMETRSEFLKRMNLLDYKEVYDIKSEVPRTTILANTGIWKPDSYDIYTEILKESKVQEITRSVIKELYMRFNFGTGTDKQRYNYYRISRIKSLQKEYDLKSYNAAERLYYYRIQDDSKYPIKNADWYYTELEYTFDEWVELRKAIEKIQGNSWGNMIFWFTSMIQVYTIYKIFKEKKIRVYNVYDGFYAPPAITKEYMVNIVEQTAKYIYKKYIKGIKI